MDFVVAPTSQYKFSFVSDVEICVKHPLQAYLRLFLGSASLATPLRIFRAALLAQFKHSQNWRFCPLAHRLWQSDFRFHVQESVVRFF
jgi:hypothetical protein